VLTAPFWNTPTAISNRGDVVGFAGDPSDPSANITHAFIWTRMVASVLNTAAATAARRQASTKRQVVGYFVAPMARCMVSYGTATTACAI
jgi:probable HAF family extracellular repeat protein